MSVALTLKRINRESNFLLGTCRRRGHVGRTRLCAVCQARRCHQIPKLPWAAFVEGSDKGETKANPEVWSNAAKFKEASEKMQGEMTKLAAAAKTGNLDSIKASVGAVGGSCKACHDVFWKQ